MVETIRGVSQIDTDYLYNAWNADGGRLQNLTSTQVSTSNPLQNLTYDYDPVGNINTIVDATNSGQKQCFQYDDLDRLTKATTHEDTAQGCTAETGFGNYSEEYDYHPTTGNLSEKNLITYTYSSGHAHAVSSLSNGNAYGYDANGNMTSRSVNEGDYELAYDAENRLVSVTGVNGTSLTANFYYDADGKRVKSAVEGETIYFVGSHYEKTGTDVVTKYYMVGATRLAMRTGSTLKYLLGDHLGSSSVATDDAGGLDVRTLYKAWGEVRFTTADKTLPTRYTFTGQYSYVADDATDLGNAGFGLMFYNARWYDPYLSRWAQPDNIVPLASQGTQAWDRYTYVNNSPVRYNDPSGHKGQENGQDSLSESEEITLILEDVFGWTFDGSWSLKELSIVYEVAEDIAAMVGGANKVYEMLGSVVFSKKKMKSGGLGRAHHVTLNEDFSSWAKRDQKWTIAHELGHAWDGANHWKLSKGMQKGVQSSYGWFLGIGYGDPGDGPPAAGWESDINRKEDFAESFTASLYGDYGSEKATSKGYPYCDFPTYCYSDFSDTPRGQYITSQFQ